MEKQNLNEAQQMFDYLIKNTEDAISSIEYPSDPKELYDPIIYALEAGGKRIRPLMVMLGYHLYKNIKDSNDQVINAALSIETFHNFTLLHDDIMDKAAVRRGRDTVHIKWNENVAILSGDAMLTYSYKLLSNVSSNHLKDVLDTFNNVALNIFEGQQYDMMFEEMDSVSIKEYVKMITLKTAVLLSGAIKIGAILADAPKEDIAILDHYATELGLAFQLQDDYLDTYGDTKTFGKEVGGDIESAKKTFLLISLLNKASEQDRLSIHSLLNNKTLSREEKLLSAKAMFDKYDIATDINKAISNHFTQAQNAINSLSCEEKGKDLLKLLSQKLINRDK